jgi:hypothetical protein
MEIRTPMPLRPELASAPAEECGGESDMLSDPCPFVASHWNTSTSPDTARFTCFPLESVSQLVFCGVDLVLSLFKARRICRAFVFLSMLSLLSLLR